MKNKGLLILWGVILLTITAIILIFFLYDPKIKQIQRMIDNLASAKSIDLYVINNAFEAKGNKFYISSLKGNSINNILNIITKSKATINIDFESIWVKDNDYTFKIMNSYYLELKDNKNNLIGKYYIYAENHLMLDDYVVTLSKQEYNNLTTELNNIISQDTGTLNCKKINEEDTFFISNSKIKNYRGISYLTKDNYEVVNNRVKQYKNKYDGFNIGLITSREGIISGTYKFSISEDKMILVKTYDFDILSEIATIELLNTPKDEFINRTFADIEKEYPEGSCKYSIW